MASSADRKTSKLIAKCEELLQQPINHATMATASFQMTPTTWIVTGAVVAITLTSIIAGFALYPGLLSILLFFRATKPTTVMAFTASSVIIIKAGLVNNGPKEVLITVAISSLTEVTDKARTVSIGGRYYRVKDGWEQVQAAMAASALLQTAASTETPAPPFAVS